MRQPRQRRTWLRPIRVFLGILIVLDLVGLLVAILQLFGGAHVIGTVQLHDLLPGATPIANPNLGLGGVQVLWHPVGTFQILMFAFGYGLGYLVASLPMLVYAYHVTDEALRNDPFTLVMVSRLRKLGLLILVGGLVSEAAAFGARWALFNDVLADQPALREGAYVDASGYSFWWLAPGLLVLAFAELVRRGCYLRAELDQVI
jgi:hypothetical protein